MGGRRFQATLLSAWYLLLLMETSRANTEPFYRFHRFNEEFNRNMRITVGSLGLALRAGATTKVNLKLPTEGEPWGAASEWRSISSVVPSAKQFISHIGLVRVLAAFEDLLICAKGEHDRCAHTRDRGSAVTLPSQNGEDDERVKVQALYRQLGWATAGIEPLIPMLSYFVVLRNCIVHRSARASEHLFRLSRSEELLQCLSNWPTPRKKALPTLPTLVVGRDIPLLPRHAIFCAEACYRIGLDLNERLRTFLGLEGIVYMAAFHGLLSDEPLRSNAYKSTQTVLNSILTSRYRVEISDQQEVASVLRRMNNWRNCCIRFTKLYPA